MLTLYAETFDQHLVLWIRKKIMKMLRVCVSKRHGFCYVVLYFKQMWHDEKIGWNFVLNKNLFFAPHTHLGGGGGGASYFILKFLQATRYLLLILSSRI